MKRILLVSITSTILVIFMISCASQTPSTTEASLSNSSTSLTTSTTTIVAPQQTWTDYNGVNSSSSKSVNNLNLTLSLNSTTYKLGQDVLITIDEYNPLTTDINVPMQNNWAYNFLTLGVCGTMGRVFGIAVFQGSYTAENISRGTPLPFWNYSITPPCPTITTPPNGYDYKPLSHDFLEMSLKGYWKGSPMASSVNFSPGVYTIVAGDEWGTSVFVHFEVTQ